MRIVVTGATGNLGTALLTNLSRQSAVTELVGIARHVPEAGVEKAKYVSADVTTSNLVEVFRGADAVVHLAWLLQPARDENKLNKVNVEGTNRVVQAAERARVPQLVVASSVGAYSKGPKDRGVDESWPTDGIESSLYSRQKAAVERMLDDAEEGPLRIVRMRPGLIFQRQAGSEIERLFLGPLVPKWAFSKRALRRVPDVPEMRFQAVHAADVAEAFARAVLRRAAGAFNLAAAPVLDSATLARALDAHSVRISKHVLRAVVAATYRLRVQPTNAGWVDLALSVPIMSTERARSVLGWEPRYTSVEALLSVLDGVRDGAGAPSGPLKPDQEPLGARSTKVRAEFSADSGSDGAGRASSVQDGR